MELEEFKEMQRQMWAAGDYRPLGRLIEPAAQILVREAAVGAGQRVLDVGTGTGVLISFILKHHPSRVLACDLSGEMLQRASLRFGDRVAILQADVVDISLDRGPFGVVFCNAAFGNVYDQRETLEAIAGLLGPTGRLVISHPMGSAFVRMLKEGSPQYHLKDLPNEMQLLQLLDGTGLILDQFTDEPDLYLAICVKTAK